MLMILFFLLCTLAIIHFIYERIALPEIRLHYRNELFVLRDEVRDVLLSGNAKDCEMHGAKVLHEALNNSINRLHYLTISNRVNTIIVLRDNPEIKEKISDNLNLIKKSKNKKINDVFTKSIEISNKVFFFNSLLAIIYFLPFFWL